MSDDRVPAPLVALVRAITRGTPDEGDERAATFAKGLALGALVGAAIAGSTIWQRRHARAATEAREDAGLEPTEPERGALVPQPS